MRMILINLNSKVNVLKKAFDICVGAYEYFEKTIYNTHDGRESKLHEDICVYYMCSFMDVISFRAKYGDNCPDFDATIREYIENLGLFTADQIDGMKSEWCNYHRKAKGIAQTEKDDSPTYRMKKAEEFWKEWNFNKLPNLMLLAKYAFLIVPSSAAAERVFSVLKHSLSLLQMHMALDDRTELQVKLCYNHMQDKWANTIEEP